MELEGDALCEVSAMDVGDGLRKVVVARVACKLPPQSALNLGFPTLWLRIGLGICWVWLLCLIWYFSMGWFSFFILKWWW